MKQGKVYINPNSTSNYKNLTVYLLNIALSNYTYETSRDTDLLVDLFCDIIHLEFNL